MVNPSRSYIVALDKGRILFPFLQQRLDNPDTFKRLKSRRFNAKKPDEGS